MEIEKIRNLTDDELEHQQRVAGEQLFRLRFQMKLGQNEGVKKLRGLRKDIARIKTIQRARALGLPGETAVSTPEHETAKADAKASPKKKSAKKPVKKAAAKKTASKPAAAKKAKPARKGAR
jgi:large subunit ribosomal protein L29